MSDPSRLGCSANCQYDRSIAVRYTRFRYGYNPMPDLPPGRQRVIIRPIPGPLPRAQRLWIVAALLLLVPACVAAVAARASVLPAEIAQPAGLTTDGAPALPQLDVPVGFDPYIYRPTGELADPVNIIFLHTDGATAAAVAERVLGWRAATAAGMMFKNRTGARPTYRHLVADLSAQVRWHLRIQAVPLSDTQTYVLASVHRDDTAPCGHVGRGFDETRDIVGRAFAEAGFPTRIVYLDNTAAGQHCDGSRVGGDGAAVLIDLSAAPRVDLPLRNHVQGAQ